MPPCGALSASAVTGLSFTTASTSPLKKEKAGAAAAEAEGKGALALGAPEELAFAGLELVDVLEALALVALADDTLSAPPLEQPSIVTQIHRER